MKDQDHPPGPEFEKASDAAEARRQQRIAALTNQQRADFGKLQDKHKDQQAERLKTHDENRQQHITERMRSHLLQSKEPHLQHPAHKHNQKRPNDLGGAINDYLSGRDTKVTREYGRQLGVAHDKAKQNVAHHEKQSMDGLKLDQKREQNKFLQNAERERGKAKEDKVRENAAGMTQQRISKGFDQAAKDKSWKRAFEKAAKQEADRGQEKNLDHDHEPLER